MVGDRTPQGEAEKHGDAYRVRRDEHRPHYIVRDRLHFPETNVHLEFRRVSADSQERLVLQIYLLV